MPAYRVVVTPAAERQLAKLRRPDREMVAAALVALAHNPRSTGCRKLQAAADLWRLRVGRYRVIYSIIDDQLLIIVVKVGDRKDVYR
jgi:mRNA interferase RelE/StbE